MENVFEDLQNQLEDSIDAQGILRLEDEERHRRASLTLRDRLTQLRHSRARFRVLLKHGLELRLLLTNVGTDWISAQADEPTEFNGTVIIAMQGIARISLEAAVASGSLGSPMGIVTDEALAAMTTSGGLRNTVNFSFVLRDLGRRRKHVSVCTTQGVLQGTIDHVGKDHLDLKTTQGMLIIPSREVVFVRIPN